MAGLVTTLFEARGWIQVHRVGRMLTAEYAEPEEAFVRPGRYRAGRSRPAA